MLFYIEMDNSIFRTLDDKQYVKTYDGAIAGGNEINHAQGFHQQAKESQYGGIYCSGNRCYSGAQGPNTTVAENAQSKSIDSLRLAPNIVANAYNTLGNPTEITNGSLFSTTNINLNGIENSFIQATWAPIMDSDVLKHLCCLGKIDRSRCGIYQSQPGISNAYCNPYLSEYCINNAFYSDNIALKV